MKYNKPPLTVEQQAELLQKRGMVADRPILIKRLSEVSYYRLSAYWYPFRIPGSDNFKPGTVFEMVWDHYVFDRQLRLMAMDAIERVEVSAKTRLIQAFVFKHGAFGHLHRVNLPGISEEAHQRFLRKIRGETEHSKEAFVEHYKARYVSERDLPLWMAVEIMDFGSMLTLFRNLDQYTKREIAEYYDLRAGVFESWLVTLNYVRNICAHHSRLWNRVLSVPPLLPKPKSHPEFHVPIAVAPDRVYAVLCLLRYLLIRVAPQSRWRQRLVHLLREKNPELPLRWMGFPEGWEASPIWK